MSTPEPPDRPAPPAASPPKPSTLPATTPATRAPTGIGAEAAAEDEDQPSTFQPWLYVKIGLLLLVIAYAIAFVVENTRKVRIDYVFGHANVRVIWTILLLLGIGVVSGILISQLYRHRRRAKLAKQGRQARDAH
jgi:uncharacterized integral membrane protein